MVTIATPDQAGEVRLLARQAGITPEVTAVKPGAREILALTGPAAPYVEPAPVAPPQPQGTGAGRRRSGGGTSTPGGSSSGRSGGSSGGRSGGSGRSSGPARTRAELAARAGQQPAGRSRRGSR